MIDTVATFVSVMVVNIICYKINDYRMGKKYVRAYSKGKDDGYEIGVKTGYQYGVDFWKQSIESMARQACADIIKQYAASVIVVAEEDPNDPDHIYEFVHLRDIQITILIHNDACELRRLKIQGEGEAWTTI